MSSRLTPIRLQPLFEKFNLGSQIFRNQSLRHALSYQEWKCQGKLDGNSVIDSGGSVSCDECEYESESFRSAENSPLDTVDSPMNAEDWQYDRLDQEMTLVDSLLYSHDYATILQTQACLQNDLVESPLQNQSSKRFRSDSGLSLCELTNDSSTSMTAKENMMEMDLLNEYLNFDKESFSP